MSPKEWSAHDWEAHAWSCILILIEFAIKQLGETEVYDSCYAFMSDPLWAHKIYTFDFYKKFRALSLIC